MAYSNRTVGRTCEVVTGLIAGAAYTVYNVVVGGSNFLIVAPVNILGALGAVSLGYFISDKLTPNANLWVRSAFPAAFYSFVILLAQKFSLPPASMLMIVAASYLIYLISYFIAEKITKGN